jgi:hypothetical protein
MSWFKRKLQSLGYGAPVKHEVGTVAFSRGWAQGTLHVLALEKTAEAEPGPHVGIKLGVRAPGRSETTYFSLTLDQAKSLRALLEKVT